MTIVMTILASDNARNRRRARRAEAAEKQQSDQRVDRLLTKAVSRCSNRVLNAVSAPSMRERQEEGAACLPDVALYQAGHRKVRKEAVHITK